MSRGFNDPELRHKKHELPVESGTYFSSIALAVWDNIHGPKLLHVWTGKNQRGKFSTSRFLSINVRWCSSLDDDRKLVTIANFTLNDEAGRNQEGIETKFYSLPKHGVIATAFVFSLEMVEGKQDVFSFFLILPYHEISEYLARHNFCQDKVEKLLDDHFVAHVTQRVNFVGLLFSSNRLLHFDSFLQSTEKVLLNEKVHKVIMEHFTRPLHSFTELMASLRAYAVPHPIDVCNEGGAVLPLC